MEKITVWTKQHKAVLETLEREGRYVAKRQFVEYENEDCAPLVLEVYDWMVKNGPNASVLSGNQAGDYRKLGQIV